MRLQKPIQNAIFTHSLIRPAEPHPCIASAIQKRRADFVMLSSLSIPRLMMSLWMVLTTAVLSGCNKSTKKSFDLDSGITLQATDAGNRFELRKAGQKIGHIQTGPDHIFIVIGERENLPQGSLRIPLGESSDEFPDAELSIRSSNKPGWTEYHRVTSNAAAAKTYPSSELNGSAYYIFETGETEPVTIGGNRTSTERDATAKPATTGDSK